MLGHLSYSPDLALCDFLLFPNNREKLRRKRNSGAEEVFAAYENVAEYAPQYRVNPLLFPVVSSNKTCAYSKMKGILENNKAISNFLFRFENLKSFIITLILSVFFKCPL